MKRDVALMAGDAWLFAVLPVAFELSNAARLALRRFEPRRISPSHLFDGDDLVARKADVAGTWLRLMTEDEHGNGGQCDEGMRRG